MKKKLNNTKNELNQTSLALKSHPLKTFQEVKRKNILIKNIPGGNVCKQIHIPNGIFLPV